MEVVWGWEEDYREQSESHPLLRHRIMELAKERLNDEPPRLTQPGLRIAATPESDVAVKEETNDVWEEGYYDEGKEHKVNEKETVMEMCATCGGIPYYWMQCKEDVVEEVDMKLKENRCTEPVAKVHRKLFYLAYISAQYSLLGKLTRVQIPSCVEDGIGNVIPGGNGEYMGYVEE